MRSTLNFRQEIAAVPEAQSPTNMSQESGMRVVTARIVSAPARSPNPASMSDPGQPDRPRRTADPATIQATIGIRVHANARTDSPNIDVAHDGNSDTPWYDQFERSLNGPAARRRELLNHHTSRSAGRSPSSVRAPGDRTSARSPGSCARARISGSRPGSRCPPCRSASTGRSHIA